MLLIDYIIIKKRNIAIKIVNRTRSTPQFLNVFLKHKNTIILIYLLNKYSLKQVVI